VISLHGTAISNLVVYLSSLNEDKVSVPAVVLLPAGQSNATFDLTAVNDSIADGNQEVMIFANASEFASAAATVTVLDDETPPAPSRPIPFNLSTGQPLEMDLRWTVAEGELIQNGDFEAGTLAGWHQDNGAASTFVINDGSLNPVGPDGPLPPFSGRFSALTDQSIPGRHTICQD